MRLGREHGVMPLWCDGWLGSTSRPMCGLTYLYQPTNAQNDQALARRCVCRTFLASAAAGRIVGDGGGGSGGGGGDFKIFF